MLEFCGSLRSRFGSGALDLTVEAGSMLMTPFAGENHQYLVDVRPSSAAEFGLGTDSSAPAQSLDGMYTVRVRDSFGAALAHALDAAGVHCAPFAFRLSLTSRGTGGGGGGDDDDDSGSGAGPTEPGCVAGSALPTDLSTTGGGSAPFGGPQQTDGSVRISGSQFVAPAGNQQRMRAVDFVVAKPSMLRVFLAAADADTDIDVLVYRITNDSRSLVFASMDAAAAESALLRVEPRPNGEPAAYQLMLYFFRASSCARFSLELAVTPVADLARVAACPVVLPALPPSLLVVRAGGSVAVFDDRYAIAASAVRAASRAGLFRHSTNISLPGNATLQASLGYNFLAQDMSLRLRSQDGRTVATSASHAAAAGGDYGFVSVLSAVVLRPGWYLLDIEDRSAALGLLKDAPDTVCMKFAYSLQGASVRRRHVQPC
jgi:hypothetical protein